MITVEITNMPMSIVDLYNYIAIKLGLDPEKCHYDCTKINVSNGIFENVQEWYKQQCKNADYKLAFGMDWCCYGPKADENLSGYNATIQDGFVKEV